MTDEEHPDLSIEEFEISEKTRKLKALWTPDENGYLPSFNGLVSIFDDTNTSDFYHHGYPNDQPTMGFSMWVKLIQIE
jgi:hypothetical protein